MLLVLYMQGIDKIIFMYYRLFISKLFIMNHNNLFLQVKMCILLFNNLVIFSILLSVNRCVLYWIILVFLYM